MICRPNTTSRAVRILFSVTDPRGVKRKNRARNRHRNKDMITRIVKNVNIPVFSGKLIEVRRNRKNKSVNYADYSMK